ncbi:polysaccharide biosynthesis C-terminal domain-containing protein [Vibrio breoganii]|uniref:oligosaccharide flippase family protein n=1 Tax=Vibrio breoganii TaxID=553239 RepID=UPI000C8616B8|nr:polysaccharide biosynthesis C-terminal domain-containing protein [Vibrio breoganii]PMJ45294.1 hypothetical protein BCU21_13895 [Vibrio breoganii]
MNNKFRNIAWYSIDKYILVAMSFITTVVLARTIAPNLLGEIVLLQSLVILFSVVTLAALDSIVIKGIIESKYCVGSVFMLKLSSAIISFFLYITYIFLSPNTISYEASFILGLPLLISFTTFIDVIMMANKDIHKLASKTCIIYLIAGAIKVYYLFFIEIDSLEFLCLLLVSDQLASRIFVCIYGIYNRYYNNIYASKIKIYLILAFEVVMKGKYLLVSSFFLIGFVRTNQIIVNYYLGSQELAYFSMPIKIVDGLTIIITTYVSAIYPYLVSSLSKEDIKSTAIKYFGLVTKIGVTVSLLVYLLSENIILILFGNEYLSSIPVLKIYAVAVIFNYIYVATGRWFIALSEPNFVALRNFCAFVSNIALSLLLIPYFGIEGAATASMLSWMFSGYLILIFSKKNRWLLLYLPYSLIKKSRFI